MALLALFLAGCASAPSDREVEPSTWAEGETDASEAEQGTPADTDAPDWLPPPCPSGARNLVLGDAGPPRYHRWDQFLGFTADLDGDQVPEAALIDWWWPGVVERWVDLDLGRSAPRRLEFRGEGAVSSLAIRLGPDADGDGVPEVWNVSNRKWSAWRTGRTGLAAAPDWTLESVDWAYDPKASGNLVGSPEADLVVFGRERSPPFEGRLFVLQGPPGAGVLEPSAAAATISAEVGGSDLFASRILVGDVTGDGADDLVLTGGSSEEGELHVFHGPLVGHPSVEDSDARILLGPRGTSTGPLWPLALGDVDGDGVADLLVGQPSWKRAAGRVLLFLGPLAGTLGAADADLVVTGAHPGALTGDTGLLVDLDHDGLDDVVVGAPRYAASGGFGSETGLTCADSGGCFRDTADGVTVRRPTGAVAIWYARYRGTVDFATADQVVVSEHEVGRFPRALFSPGDLDGDGRRDLVVDHVADVPTGSVKSSWPAVTAWTPCP